MNILIFGGAGFVGLNIAEAALAAGHDIVLFDRAAIPGAAHEAFARLPGRVATVVADGQAALHRADSCLSGGDRADLYRRVAGA